MYRDVHQLGDGTGGSVDAVIGAAIGPYRKSRLSGDELVPLALGPSLDDSSLILKGGIALVVATSVSPTLR